MLSFLLHFPYIRGGGPFIFQKKMKIFQDLPLKLGLVAGMWLITVAVIQRMKGSFNSVDKFDAFQLKQVEGWAFDWWNQWKVKFCPLRWRVHATTSLRWIRIRMEESQSCKYFPLIIIFLFSFKWKEKGFSLMDTDPSRRPFHQQQQQQPRKNLNKSKLIFF